MRYRRQLPSRTVVLLCSTYRGTVRPRGPNGRRVGAEGEGGELSRRAELEGAAAKHGGGQASHNRLSLHVQVSVHFVGPPAADEANAVAVDACAQERHGAAGPR